jgi:hypothetical protein
MEQIVLAVSMLGFLFHIPCYQTTHRGLTMSRDPNDVVKLYSGPLVVVESYREALRDAGIESRIVGTALTSVFGGAIPDTIELWVHQGDVQKATATIERYEQRKGENKPQHHAHPTSGPKPSAAPVRKEPYTNPDPAGN